MFMAALAVAALAGTLAVAPVVAPPAHAAASVSVANAAGSASADPDVATPMTVSGAGFQAITGGFGGIYVLFGWVDSGWRPSEGGASGSDYRYVPDQEAKENAGYQRFVAFQGSETESAANAVMDASGGWSVDITIPGASFESEDRSGGVSSVDCREVQCGIITIGAHGVVNPSNETFTPIAFTAAAGGAAAPAAGGAAAPAAGEAAGAVPAAGGIATAARVGYTATTAVAGNALSFAGRGFTAGEQVVATLDDGVVAVGPLTAGIAGEVAGVLSLPADLRAGTHVLILTGAASGAVAQTEVAVTAAGGAAGATTGGTGALVGQAAAPASEVPAWLYLVMAFAILVALTLLLISLGTSLVRARRRRRARRVEAAAVAAAAAAAQAEVVAAEVVSSGVPSTSDAEDAGAERSSLQDAPTALLEVTR